MIVDSIVKGCWFTIIEVLTGIELAKNGFAPMGAFALMSCQNFQISVLFALIILLNTMNGFSQFILFEEDHHVNAALENIFLIGLAICVLIIMTTILTVFFIDKFKISKKRVNLLMQLYSVFFICAMLVGIFFFN